jgi:AraC-like DNA-binding protein
MDRPPPADVATVLPATTRARIDAAVGPACRTYHASSVSEVLHRVRERPVRAVFVSPQAVSRPELPQLARLVRGFPDVATLAVTSSRDDLARPQALLDLGATGVRGVIDLGARDGWHRLRAVVADPATTRGALILQRLVPALGPEATDECRQFFGYLVRVAPAVTTVRQLSRDLATAPSTFMSRFFRASLPSPKRYLAGVRLVYAAALLEAPGRSIADVAYALEFSSPQSFGRHVRAVLGICATDFRRRYGFSSALEEFLAGSITPYRQAFRSFRPLIAGTADLGYRS